MDDEKRMQIVMGIIMAGGNAKAHAVEAITAAKKATLQKLKRNLKKPTKLLSTHTIRRLKC